MAEETQTETLSVDPNSDEAIFDNMLNGVESQKEATDVRVAQMLKEEAAEGRGVEPFVHEAEKSAEEAEKAEAKQAEDAAKAKAETEQQKPEESDSQRRRRLRREAENRTRSDLSRTKEEVIRLRERVRMLQERAPDKQAYGDDVDTYVADRAAASAQYANVSEQLERSEAAERAAEEKLQAESAQSYNEYIAEGKKKYSDFDKVIQSDALIVTPAMTETLLDDGMQEVAYELAKNPLEMNAIAALPTPIEQVRAILKKQAALEARAAEATQSKAPPPIKTVKGASASTAKHPSQMTMAEYENFRKQQLGMA
jgi:hypothetical protein